MDINYKCGMDGSFEAIELQYWPVIAKMIAEELKSTFGNQNTIIENVEGKIYGLKLSGYPILIIHPLWDMENIAEKWLKNAKNELIRKLNPTKDMIYIDTFNGIRRLAKCKTWQ